MPIRIPDALPAAAQLESENIFVMTEYRALHQDIRPLRVLSWRHVLLRGPGRPHRSYAFGTYMYPFGRVFRVEPL